MSVIKKRFHRCSKCGNIAKWYYMPSTSGRRFYCDECVPRGCSCNTYSIEEDGEPVCEKNFVWINKELGEYEYLDRDGKREPCCEYDYDENGQDFYTTVKKIKKNDIIDVWIKTRHYLKENNDKIIVHIFESILLQPEEILYNPFMMQISEITHHWAKGFNGIGSDAIKFYNSFRAQCEEKSFKEYTWCD